MVVAAEALPQSKPSESHLYLVKQTQPETKQEPPYFHPHNRGFFISKLRTEPIARGEVSTIPLVNDLNLIRDRDECIQPKGFANYTTDHSQVIKETIKDEHGVIKNVIRIGWAEDDETIAAIGAMRSWEFGDRKYNELVLSQLGKAVDSGQPEWVLDCILRARGEQNG